MPERGDESLRLPLVSSYPAAVQVRPRPLWGLLLLASSLWGLLQVLPATAESVP